MLNVDKAQKQDSLTSDGIRDVHFFVFVFIIIFGLGLIFVAVVVCSIYLNEFLTDSICLFWFFSYVCFIVS